MYRPVEKEESAADFSMSCRMLSDERMGEAFVFCSNDASSAGVRKGIRYSMFQVAELSLWSEIMYVIVNSWGASANTGTKRASDTRITHKTKKMNFPIFIWCVTSPDLEHNRLWLSTDCLLVFFVNLEIYFLYTLFKHF